MPRYFPVALSVENRRCVVVGGGLVAARRVRSLLEAGAGAITVVAPRVCEDLRRLAAEGVTQFIMEPYRQDHLQGAFLAIACTDSTEVNEAVVVDCRAQGILAANAETCEHGDFVIPSVVRRGDLLLSVTTGGASPALASKIAAELNEKYGHEYSLYMLLLSEAREAAMRQIDDKTARRSALRKLAEDSAILDLIRAGNAPKARQRAMDCISSSSD